MKKKIFLDVKNPVNQLSLYGYNLYFDIFRKLFNDKKIPNIILLNGPKGIGKSTFIHHLINYFVSLDEDKKYNIVDKKINQDNRSYNLICNNLHPNFFSLTTNSEKKDIKVDEVRSLLKFLYKSSYSLNEKYVLIDSADKLNLNSSNSLLKIIEEPPINTFFFIINDSKRKILPTIKSRAFEFKIFLTFKDKKNILANIIKDYNVDIDINEAMQKFYFDTPGNILKYSLLMSNSNLNLNEETHDLIFHFIDLYKKEKNTEILDFISILIEIFYNKLYIKDNKNLNRYSFNKTKISTFFKDMKKYNLNESNVFFNITDILKNEIR